VIELFSTVVTVVSIKSASHLTSGNFHIFTLPNETSLNMEIAHHDNIVVVYVVVQECFIERLGILNYRGISSNLIKKVLRAEGIS